MRRDLPAGTHAWTWPELAAGLAPLLQEAAGPGASAASVNLNLAAAEPGALRLSAWAERATRTLVFLSAEARNEAGGLVAVATAVFRRG